MLKALLLKKLVLKDTFAEGAVTLGTFDCHAKLEKLRWLQHCDAIVSENQISSQEISNLLS